MTEDTPVKYASLFLRNLTPDKQKQKRFNRASRAGTNIKARVFTTKGTKIMKVTTRA